MGFAFLHLMIEILLMISLFKNIDIKFSLYFFLKCLTILINFRSKNLSNLILYIFPGNVNFVIIYYLILSALNEIKKG